MAEREDAPRAGAGAPGTFVRVNFRDPNGIGPDDTRGTLWSWTIEAEGAEARVQAQLEAWRAEGRDITAEVRPC